MMARSARLWYAGTLLLLAGAGLAASPIVLVVNGKPVAADVPVQVIGGKAFLPLRATANALGAQVEWQPDRKTAALCLDNRCYPVCLTDPHCEARVIKGRTMLPVRMIAELLGCKVEWDGKTRTIAVTASQERKGREHAVHWPASAPPSR